ncbi:unnamed protein product [Ectocarpus sp. 12 AP-2014]
MRDVLLGCCGVGPQGCTLRYEKTKRKDAHCDGPDEEIDSGGVRERSRNESIWATSKAIQVRARYPGDARFCFSTTTPQAGAVGDFVAQLPSSVKLRVKHIEYSSCLKLFIAPGVRCKAGQNPLSTCGLQQGPLR